MDAEQSSYQISEDLMTLNMGPQHPSTHGAIRFIITGDGEIMQQAVPVVGYLHRGIEKLAEGMPYPSFVPFTDRVDYLAAMFANHGYVLAVERLLGVEVPRRAEYLRVIVSEVNRIASHLIGVGAMAMDIGAFTPFLHGIREREKLNDLLEALCGSRLTYNYIRVGGVSRDLQADFRDDLLRFLDSFGPFVAEFNRLITENEILIKRCANVAVIDAETAISYGLSGPNLRGSGVDHDLRRDLPYSVYNEFDYRICLGRGAKGVLGDAYDRFLVRIEEMIESEKILRQALDGLPDDSIMAKVPRKMKPSKGEAYGAVESARGELGYHVIAGGADKPYRVKIRAGSYTATSIVEEASRGLMIADLVVLIGSLDVVAPEIDR